MLDFIGEFIAYLLLAFGKEIEELLECLHLIP